MYKNDSTFTKKFVDNIRRPAQCKQDKDQGLRCNDACSAHSSYQVCVTETYLGISRGHVSARFI